jgi:hypothetical protein
MVVPDKRVLKAPEECLDDALLVEEVATIGVRSGMFGGCSPKERVRLARERRMVAS